MLSKRISSIGMFIVSEMTENPTAKYEKFWFPASLLINCGFESAVVSVSDTNCGIAHILGILLMNSCNTDIFFSNYYHLQSVRFELLLNWLCCQGHL